MQWYALAQSAKKTRNPYVVSEMEGHVKTSKTSTTNIAKINTELLA